MGERGSAVGENRTAACALDADDEFAAASAYASALGAVQPTKR